MKSIVGRTKRETRAAQPMSGGVTIAPPGFGGKMVL